MTPRGLRLGHERGAVAPGRHRRPEEPRGGFLGPHCGWSGVYWKSQVKGDLAASHGWDYRAPSPGTITLRLQVPPEMTSRRDCLPGHAAEAAPGWVLLLPSRSWGLAVDGPYTACGVRGRCGEEAGRLWRYSFVFVFQMKLGWSMGV